MMSALMGKIKKGVPKINIQAMNFHTGHRLFLCFLLGIVAGTFLTNVLLADFADKIGIYNKYFVKGANVYDVNVDKMDFFIFCIKKYLIELIIILLINMTQVGILFDKIYCIYKGIIISILISSATITYGAWGIVLYLISIFPQYLLYIPFLICTLYISIRLSQILKEHNLKEIKIRAIVITLVLLAGTAFFESFANLSILKSAFS